jgi:acyl-CoA synthetase (AMP-forming)/AMP-acid ligase II
MSEVPLIITGGRAVVPQEVERVLLSHPAVAEAAVIGVPPFDESGDEIVAAAIRLCAPLPAAAADLTGYCRTRLAGYQIPVRWLLGNALPRTAAGTVRRGVLAAQLTVVSRPRVTVAGLRIPRQARRVADDLDY